MNFFFLFSLLLLCFFLCAWSRSGFRDIPYLISVADTACFVFCGYSNQLHIGFYWFLSCRVLFLEYRVSDSRSLQGCNL
ncbi:hypothetical protein BDV10DRAFT_41046 [Aspergillus recurvatus]